MRFGKLIFLTILMISSGTFLSAQKVVKKAEPDGGSVKNNAEFIKSSPAFAEIILRKTELQSDLESLLISYTEEFPKVQELRFETGILDKEIERLGAVKAADSSKLTLALGKLMVRKAELETDFWGLQKKYGDEHPEVKRAKRKVEIYENSIKAIIQ